MHESTLKSAFSLGNRAWGGGRGLNAHFTTRSRLRRCWTEFAALTTPSSSLELTPTGKYSHWMDDCFYMSSVEPHGGGDGDMLREGGSSALQAQGSCDA